jgi:hypothetical protein
MSDPMIIVEGSLRLPSLRPLADSALHYGREWAAARCRASPRRSEKSVLAAQMQTAYVEAVALSGPDASYRAVSIWGVFADGPKRLSMLQLLQGALGSGAANPQAAQTEPTEPQAEAIQLHVGQPATEPAHESRMPAFIKTAIAIACAALVSWLIVAHETRTPDDETARAAKRDDSPARHDEPPVAQMPSPLPVATPAPAAAVVAQASAAEMRAPASDASAPRVVSVTPSAPASVASADIRPIPEEPPALPRRRAGAVETLADVPATANAKPQAKAASARSMQQTKPSSTHKTRPLKTPDTKTPKPGLDAQNHRNRTPSPHTRHTPRQSNEAYYPVPAKPRRDYAASGRPSYRGVAPAPLHNPSIDTQALYNMLQHSPTLDSNVDPKQASAQ